MLPLAERMRPKTIDEVIGQHHLLGQDGPIRKLFSMPILPSILLWGPPGTGKTTLAQLLATHNKTHFVALSAINAGVKEIREVIEGARHKGRTVLFIDEIHRFSKSQQDSLLGAIEKGIITLIGATTENPSFEVVPALLSRCQIYTLYSLSTEELRSLVDEAVSSDELLRTLSVKVLEYDALLKLSGGDARKLLNLLELVLLQEGGGQEIRLTNERVMQIAQRHLPAYDKSGEQHYNIVSAFIKSVRGSDPNAAVYWLARMLEGGEDPTFIARRLIILASEDIGNANPTALILANGAFDAVHKVGMPEAEIILSQAVVYLACSTKSNTSYVAVKKAKQMVRESPRAVVPLHLRNAATSYKAGQGYGKDYKYAHQYENQFVLLEFMPEGMEGNAIYIPGENPRENGFRGFLKQRWKEKYGY